MAKPRTDGGSLVNEAHDPASRRILVTGACGFIGRSVVPLLVAAGFEVVGTTTRIVDAVGFKGSELVEWDFPSGRIPSVGTVDTVVHLAGLRPSISHSWADYQSVNVESIGGVFPFAKTRFILLSPRLTWVEEWGWSPKSFYEVSKLAAEHYLQALVAASPTGVAGSILRVGEVVGERRNDNLVDQLYLNALSGKPLIVSRFERDLVHVETLAQVILSEVARLAAASSLRRVEVVPAGPVSVQRLAEVLVEATSSESTVNVVDYRPSDRPPVDLGLERLAVSPSSAALRQLLKGHGYEV